MRILTGIILVLYCFMPLKAESAFETKEIATNLDTPWEILWGPDDYIWITERYGRISKVNPETGEVFELIKLNDVFEDGERGLMGMVLHPQFEQNPYAYTVFTYKGRQNQTLIKTIRLTYDGTKLFNPITIIDSIQGAWNHDGSRLIIDDDLTLYMTMGDAAIPALAQNTNSLNGKILRMNLDGSIPSDNPFPNSYIWSFGHRNPQGLIKINGKMYSSEHGANSDDELNIIDKGRNYGWPNVEGYCDKNEEKTFCTTNNIVEPIAAWTPTLAVAGIDYYNHNHISEWKNSILMVVLKSSRLVQLKLSDNGNEVVEENHFFTNEFGRLRDICISPNGRVFISTSNKDGRGNPAQNDDRIIEIIPINSGIEDNSNSKLRIFPNPIMDKLNINIPGKIIKTIEIYDSKGFSVYKAEGNNPAINIEIDDFFNNSSGLYFIRVNTNKGFFSDKFIIAK